MNNPLKIAIVDPHDLVRRSLHVFFENRPDVLIVGEASSASEMLCLCRQAKPHVVVFDFASQEEICLIEQLRKRYQQVKVLVLTTNMDVEYVSRAVQAGASGYLFKGLSGNELEQMLRAVNEGQRVFDKEVEEFLLAFYQ